MLGYNRMFGYNTSRYNGEGTEIQALETLTISDIVDKEFQTLKNETLISTDVLTKNITEKVVAEEILLAAWIDLDRDPAQNDWGD